VELVMLLETYSQCGLRRVLCGDTL